MDMIKWVMENYVEMLIALGSLTAALEIIVRLTPTKTDDGFLQRFGGMLKQLMDALKIPNNLKNPEEKKDEVSNPPSGS